jgi:predicted Fe-S protein YdhL (DUF1289 family)
MVESGADTAEAEVLELPDASEAQSQAQSEIIPAYGKTDPTLEDLLSATPYGRHWNAVGDDWLCPACNRSPHDITRWHKSQNWGRSVVMHHDHLRPGGKPRFKSVILCEDCNYVDADIKRELLRSTRRTLVRLTADELLRRHAALRVDFSLSAPEIAEVVIARPHQRHIVRMERAFPIVRRITQAFYAARQDSS